MSPPAPVDVDGLTPRWLGEALGFDVAAVAIEPIGTGQTAATYRVTFDAAGPRRKSVPRTLVAKVAAGDAAARARVAEGYRTEVGFYAHVAPTVDVRTPGCRFAAITEDATRFTLLLDDLAPREPGVQVDGCDVARAVDAVINLAGLHAPRWCDATLHDLPFLPPLEPDGAAFIGSIARSATEGFVDRYREALDDIDVVTLRDAAEAVADWLLARPTPFAPIHGDYRLDNLLFPPGGDGVVAVDWQTLGVGVPARDLAYFLATSVGVDDRRAHETAIVERYHRELVRRGVVAYDVDACFDDYRFGQLHAPMITTIGCMYATATRSGRADAMFLAMARRSCAAIRDLATLDLV